MRTVVAMLLMTCVTPAWAAHDSHTNGTDGMFIALVILSVLGALLAIYKRRPIPFSTNVVFAVCFFALASAGWVLFARQTPFASHMLVQMVLMDVAAPLVAVTFASTRRFQRNLPSRIFPHNMPIRFLFSGTAHAAIMWAWHVPAIYTIANSAPVLHGAMLASFLLAGVVFWNAIVAARGAKPGLALFWLFMMVMHTGFLGALLTFAPTPLYSVTLEDQRLGGLMMWVIGTSIYGLAGLFIAARWLAILDGTKQHERTV